MNFFIKSLISLILFTSLSISYASERNTIEQLLTNPDVQQSVGQLLDKIMNDGGENRICIPIGPDGTEVCAGCSDSGSIKGCDIRICSGSHCAFCGFTDKGPGCNYF